MTTPTHSVSARRRTRRLLKLILWSALTLSLCLLLPACRKGGEEIPTDPASSADQTDPAASPETAPPESPDTLPETAPETLPETEPETQEPLVIHTGFPASQAGASSEEILRVSDFGAVGDGVTDDGPAICAAVSAAASRHATLQFDGGKTYYIGSATNSAGIFRGALALSDASGVTLDGQGAVILSAPGLSHFALTGCSDVVIKNFIFDYSVPVYLVGTVQAVSGNTVTYATDMEPARDSYDFTAVNGFSIRYNEGVQNRPHAFMGKMTKTAPKTVRVEYRTAPGVSVGDLVFLPNPGIGHAYSESVYVGGCTGALMCQNLTIRSAPSFIMAIKNNTAEIYFDHVDMLPDTENGRAIHMVSWRDGYHCKDNRLPIHWNACRAGVMFDDVFNISNTLGYVTRASGTDSITACNYEFYTQGQRIAFNVRPGDTVDVYNISTGAFCGSATVRRTIANADGTTTMILEYGQGMKGVTEGCVVANRATGAPGSTITDSSFTGTFRFLRDLRVENTTFEMLAMWIMVEGSVEGPLPGNIDFVNCTFTNGMPQIDAMNRGSGKYFKKIGAAITDIGFWGCTFPEKGKITSTAKATYTISDTWTPDDLFTQKNKPSEIIVPTLIAPTADDFLTTVTYDWTRHTMTLAEGEAKTLLLSRLPDGLQRVLALSPDVSERVLLLTGKSLSLPGLDASTLPFLHANGMTYTISVTLLGGEAGSLTLCADGKPVGDALSFPAGKCTTLTYTYKAASSVSSLSLSLTGGGEVYVGHISVTSASNKNPSVEQLKNSHTFTWTDEVRIGNGTPMLLADLPADLRAALEGPESGFTNGTVLHLTDGFGGFTGLTDSAYYVAGTTYHISLDAYIASEMIPAGGTTVYLLALDSTPGNRVLAKGLFTGTGLYHFEMDWTVGSTGERALSFYISNTPAAYPDVYIGDFTLTVARSFKPAFFETRSDYASVTTEQLRAGYLFDFTDGNLCDMGSANYAVLTAMDETIAEKLNALGFGDVIYYAAENFHLNPVNAVLRPGHTYEIRLQVYDVIGNLATSGARGVFVLLNMGGGVQRGAEVNYTVEVDPADSRLMTLTFRTAPPAGADDLYFYKLTNMEFIIGSVAVTEK